MAEPAIPTEVERKETRELAARIVEAVRADEPMPLPDDVEDAIVVSLDERMTAAVKDLYFRLAQEIELLHAQLNTPHTADFIEAVRIESAHQRERWGVQHDANKAVEDWAALFVRLLGKMVDAHWNGDVAKLLHHVITFAAVAANCHARLTERLDAIGRAKVAAP